MRLDTAILVRLTAAEQAALRVIAEAQGASMASLARVLIRRELAQRAPQEEAQA